MSSPTAVRPAGAGDADVVYGLACELATSFPPERDAFDRSFGRLLEDERACVLVSCAKTLVVGYLLGAREETFLGNGPLASVEELMVDPAFQGAGHGRALLAAFEAWAAGGGCGVVAIATTRAVSFFARLGYLESATYLRKLIV